VDLKRAANKTLEKNCTKIAQSLLDHTLKGNVQSARLLVALAEGPTESVDAEETRDRRSVATELAAEPEWKADAQESGAEEPEG
jgi:hypothetical protein